MGDCTVVSSSETGVRANAGDATLQPGYGQVQVLVELCSKGYVDVSFGTQLLSGDKGSASDVARQQTHWISQE
ncbi:unnamed protein product [Gadus morhua 'NCC']